MGLLVKYDDTYNHTTIGKIIYHDYLLRLEKDISNSKQMEMVDALNQSSRLNEDEIKEIFPNMRWLPSIGCHIMQKRCISQYMCLIGPEGSVTFII